MIRTKFPGEPENAIRTGSVRTFLDALEKIDRSENSQSFYRGHASYKYELKPSIYRDESWLKNEDIMFKELILRCPNDFSNLETTFQTLVKMQHYALPTRLLDLTTNPLIALFFAIDPVNPLSESGEVLVFQIPTTDIKYFDSDTVSVISNIAKRPNSFTVPQDKMTLSKFNKNKEISYLLHEIKNEKPYFKPVILKKHLESVVCVKPKMDNPRIIRQDGAFFLFGVDGNKNQPSKVPDKYKEGITGNRILIIGSEKKKIRKQLKALGITKGTVYPEIEKVAEFIKDQYETQTKSNQKMQPTKKAGRVSRR